MAANDKFFVSWNLLNQLCKIFINIKTLKVDVDVEKNDSAKKINIP